MDGDSRHGIKRGMLLLYASMLFAMHVGYCGRHWGYVLPEGVEAGALVDRTRTNVLIWRVTPTNSNSRRNQSKQ